MLRPNDMDVGWIKKRQDSGANTRGVYTIAVYLCLPDLNIIISWAVSWLRASICIATCHRQISKNIAFKRLLASLGP